MVSNQIPPGGQSKHPINIDLDLERKDRKDTLTRPGTSSMSLHNINNFVSKPPRVFKNIGSLLR